MLRLPPGASEVGDFILLESGSVQAVEGMGVHGGLSFFFRKRQTALLISSPEVGAFLDRESVYGEVLGFEALSRGPEDGPFVEPQRMFETARAAGLETELDLLCQRRAILGARGLEPGKKLFVNALPTTLLEGAGGVASAVEWIDRAGLQRGDVVIEFSERGPVSQGDHSREALDPLRAAGVGIALDDIGTGLTGLQAIQEMHPDYLKLDVSLVHNIHTVVNARPRWATKAPTDIPSSALGSVQRLSTSGRPMSSATSPPAPRGRSRRS